MTREYLYIFQGIGLVLVVI